ncbi:3-methyladenine DNA glycosylase [Haloechinothrix sp. YIM 98757]|uniref:3-methyladenine DNA glycosylase n=1 Tax=Haloechinothrix aidingensis TaxID=2752311 RepID=A0A837ZYR7_9PSEU|nr:3-methyladenine DNA glycosylase [Haloechinothrix aidingensis]MBA0125766.1 3-methyladenine DNA glycosylase [Haloechinothrix aidingensis]
MTRSDATLAFPHTVLAEEDWRARERAHAERVRHWTEPHRQRKARGAKHPVWDFLFTYYSYRPSRLERWQPGPGVVLTGTGARQFLDRAGYRVVSEGVTLDMARFDRTRSDSTRFILSLLEATAGRQARLNCFGLHEWAMVYREHGDAIRHSEVPLRLGADGTNDVVDALDVRCSHYDAYRFFTEAAKPLNSTALTRSGQRTHEQPGCLHANMDLFKWAYKLDPFVPSELLADTFELAARVRELDMRASPYDLSDYGFSPVRIETSQGRAEYARAQAEFARRAASLRATLIDHCRTLLGDGGEPDAAGDVHTGPAAMGG